MDISTGLIAIGAGLAVMTGMMTGIGEGFVAGKAVEAIGKNHPGEYLPESPCASYNQ